MRKPPANTESTASRLKRRLTSSFPAPQAADRLTVGRTLGVRDRGEEYRRREAAERAEMSRALGEEQKSYNNKTSKFGNTVLSSKESNTFMLIIAQRKQREVGRRLNMILINK